MNYKNLLNKSNIVFSSIIIILLIIIIYMIYMIVFSQEAELRSASEINNTNISNIGSEYNPKESFQNAESLLNLKKYEEALNIYNEMIDKGYGNPIVISQLFAVNLQLENIKEALDAYYILISLSEKKEALVWSHIDENNISDRLMDIVSEISEKEEKKELEDIHLLYIKLAKIHFEIWEYYYYKDYTKYKYIIIFNYLLAVDKLDKSIKYHETAEAHYLKWYYLWDIKIAFNLAETELRKAIELDNSKFIYYYRLWNIYRDTNRHEKAKQQFIKWIELEKNYEKLYLNLWNAYYELWEKEKSDESYINWLKVCVDMCSEINSNIWLHFFEEDNYEEALKYINNAIKTNTEHYDNYNTKWSILYKMGNYLEAIKYFKISISWDYKISESNYLIWNCYLNLLDYKNAKIYFEKTLESDLNYTFAQEALDELRKTMYWDHVFALKWSFRFNKDLFNLSWSGFKDWLTLYYRSETDYNWPVWINWSHTYNNYLMEEENWNVMFYTWDLQIFRFLKNKENNTFKNTLDMTLKKIDWKYIIKFENGNKFIYEYRNDTWKLIKLSSINYLDWNITNISYINWKITSLKNKSGDIISFEYFPNDRARKISLNDSNYVNFEYHKNLGSTWSLNDLKNIKFFNEKGVSKSVNFEYTKWLTKYNNHNISKVFDNKDNIIIENFYNTKDQIIEQNYDNKIIKYEYIYGLDNKISKWIKNYSNWLKAVYFYNTFNKETEVTYSVEQRKED